MAQRAAVVWVIITSDSLTEARITIGLLFGTRGSNGKANRVVGEREYLRQTWHERPFVSQRQPMNTNPDPTNAMCASGCCTDLTSRRDSVML
jgi:hypothetical protein